MTTEYKVIFYSKTDDLDGLANRLRDLFGPRAFVIAPVEPTEGALGAMGRPIDILRTADAPVFTTAGAGTDMCATARILECALYDVMNQDALGDEHGAAVKRLISELLFCEHHGVCGCHTYEGVRSVSDLLADLSVELRSALIQIRSTKTGTVH